MTDRPDLFARLAARLVDPGPELFWPPPPAPFAPQPEIGVPDQVLARLRGTGLERPSPAALHPPFPQLRPDPASRPTSSVTRPEPPDPLARQDAGRLVTADPWWWAEVATSSRRPDNTATEVETAEEVPAPEVDDIPPPTSDEPAVTGSEGADPGAAPNGSDPAPAYGPERYGASSDPRGRPGWARRRARGSTRANPSPSHAGLSRPAVPSAVNPASRDLTPSVLGPSNSTGPSNVTVPSNVTGPSNVSGPSSLVTPAAVPLTQSKPGTPGRTPIPSAPAPQIDVRTLDATPIDATPIDAPPGAAPPGDPARTAALDAPIRPVPHRRTPSTPPSLAPPPPPGDELAPVIRARAVDRSPKRAPNAVTSAAPTATAATRTPSAPASSPARHARHGRGDQTIEVVVEIGQLEVVEAGRRPGGDAARPLPPSVSLHDYLAAAGRR